MTKMNDMKENLLGPESSDLREVGTMQMRKMQKSIAPELKGFSSSDEPRNFFDILICTLAFCKGEKDQTLSSTLKEHFKYFNTEDSNQLYFASQLDEFEKILNSQGLLIRDEEGYVQLTPRVVWKIYNMLAEVNAVQSGSLDLAKLFIAYPCSDQEAQKTLAELIKLSYNQFVSSMLPKELNLDVPNHLSETWTHKYHDLQKTVDAACILAETSEVLPCNFSEILTENPLNILNPQYQEAIKKNQPVLPVQQPAERDFSSAIQRLDGMDIALLLELLGKLLLLLFHTLSAAVGFVGEITR